MQGLAVVPLFAGFDTRRSVGRIFTYDVTGGRYEESDFHATGSGGRDARTTIKLGWRTGMTRDEAIELAVQASVRSGRRRLRHRRPRRRARHLSDCRHDHRVRLHLRSTTTEVAERFAALVARRSDAEARTVSRCRST